MREKKRRRCAGYPLHTPCENEAGPENPYWCPDCDERRCDTITRQLEALVESFKEPEP